MDQTALDSDSTSFVDRELVPLYLKYPELNVDFDEGRPPETEESDILSSPVASSTCASESTTRTTPPGPDAFNVTAIHSDEYQELLRLLRDSDLPNATCIYFESLANRVLQVGGLLSQTYHFDTIQSRVAEVLHHCRILQSSLEWSRQQAEDQIAHVAHIQTLAPFTVRPETEDLVSNYHQMAELVVEHLHIPSKAERDILSSLTRIYDAYMYNSALAASRNVDFAASFIGHLNSLYHLHMSLLEKYKSWCQGMVDLKNNHMRPSVERIWSLPAARQAYRETHRLKEAAEKAGDDPSTHGLQLVDEKTLEALRLNARRKALGPNRVEPDFRRGQTV